MKTKLKNFLGHTALGLLIGAIVYACTMSLLAAYLAQSFYYLGRERRDHEIFEVGKDLAHSGWWKGWDIGNWSSDGKRDLLGPVILNGLVALGISLI